MEYSPNLSIIIPAYNVKAYIRQAVESALRQSWKQMEIIIIDDGSTDGTLGALDTLDDPRLRRVRQVHAGLAAARNAGIRAARGEYLGFLDGDDLWASTKADRHLLFFRNHPQIFTGSRFGRHLSRLLNRTMSLMLTVRWPGDSTYHHLTFKNKAWLILNAMILLHSAIK